MVDPIDFIEQVRGKTDPDLANTWRRATSPELFSTLPRAVVECAFDAIHQWHGERLFTIDSRQSQGICGALATIVRRIRERPEEKEELARRLALFFQSQNVNVAFSTVRQFDSVVPDCSQYVRDELIDVARAQTLTDFPGPMSLRAMAFIVLFELDSSYTHWPILSAARTECLSGCQAWSNTDKYREVLGRINREINSSQTDPDPPSM